MMLTNDDYYRCRDQTHIGSYLKRHSNGVPLNARFNWVTPDLIYTRVSRVLRSAI